MKANAGRNRVFLVDDHPVVIHGLSALINGEPDLEVCGTAEGCASAMEFLRGMQPDLAIVDLSLKDGDGIELIQSLKVLRPGTRVIAYSMHDESLQAARALNAGAAGYVTKQGSFDSLLTAIRKVMAGGTWISDKIASQMEAEVSRGVTPGKDSRAERLTHREFDVFRLLGEGRSASRIAQELHASAKTVERYLEVIQAKLKAKDRDDVRRISKEWAQKKGFHASHFKK
jgi:DNA-binding NarL/FixJ family response regulator